MKQCKYTKMIRWGLPVMAILFIMLCRHFPELAEGYARNVYPLVSSSLSAFSSLFSFSLEEWLVVFIVLWMIVFPIRKRKRGGTWKVVFMREIEVLVWVYVWFYFGWGLNYFRNHVYERMQVQPVGYEETAFMEFLTAYTDNLNVAYMNEPDLSSEIIEREVKHFYGNLPEQAGLVSPKAYQKPKFFTFTSLYSGVGVLGSMGPFFAEAQLNGDLLPVQLPFTYAHEFSHLLGVSNEAEANYWAYRACTESDVPEMRYAGYFGLFPYVLSNASRLLDKETFQTWLKTVRPEIKDEYERKRMYWQEKYSPLIGEVQEVAYDLFLKGNKISTGQKNYAEVIGILIAMQENK